jgi:hypothetical protein
MIFHRVRKTILFSVMALIAVSCSTVPAAPPVPERKNQEVISWEISPAEGYTDTFGYVRLEFTPSGSDPTLPAGGRLTVHLGRQSLDHANTVWYSYTVTEGSTTLISLDGEIGIPNIKGPDGNWWDDIDFDLPRPVFHEIHVTIEDRKINATYAFTLRKLVHREEGS